jgi:hypothetical protein
LEVRVNVCYYSIGDRTRQFAADHALR